MIDRIIWDWNGTLLNDVNRNCALMNRMLRRRGMPAIPSLTRYREIFRFPIREYYRAAGFDFQKESYEELAAEYLAEYPEESLSCPLTEGAEDAIAAFREAGLSQSVLSAGESGCLSRQMEHLGLTGVFDAVIALDNGYGGGKIKAGKRWLSQSGADPKTAVLIGDTDHDWETADALGCRCVLISCGHQSEQALKKLGVPVFSGIRGAKEWVLKTKEEEA